MSPPTSGSPRSFPSHSSHAAPSTSELDGETCEPGAIAVCYSGPEGTEGKGQCSSGFQTCREDSTWGPCEDEVLPSLELCDNGIDEDCSGVADDVLDIDGDGYNVCEGDCCETRDQCASPGSVNPGAIDVPSEEGQPASDENCNGMVDEELPLCDTGLNLEDPDARMAAAAIDLCQDASAGGFGVISAAYTRADGSPFEPNAQHGLQSTFGSNVVPRLGDGMLALSTGHARVPAQPDECNQASCSSNFGGSAPSGFPQDVPNCPGSTNINDDVTLSLNLRAPANATGYSFDFMFYSFEYPEFVCSSFNDQFVAIVTPAPEGSINGNIAFDSMTNPVSVNIAFFDVCEGCPEGTTDLEGTGFDSWNDAGATRWLRTQAPVQGGSEFTIDFTIWDTGDTALDSTVLIDNFRWLAEPVDVGTDSHRLGPFPGPATIWREIAAALPSRQGSCPRGSPRDSNLRQLQSLCLGSNLAQFRVCLCACWSPASQSLPFSPGASSVPERPRRSPSISRAHPSKWSCSCRTTTASWFSIRIQKTNGTTSTWPTASAATWRNLEFATGIANPPDSQSFSQTENVDIWMGNGCDSAPDQVSDVRDQNCEDVDDFPDVEDLFDVPERAYAVGQLLAPIPFAAPEGTPRVCPIESDKRSRLCHGRYRQPWTG